MIKGRWKKFLSALMIGTMVCSLAGCAKGQGEKEQVTLRMTHTQQPDSISDLTAKEFKKEVEKKSDGRIKVEIYQNCGLSGGDLTKAIELVQAGNIDIHACAPANIANYDPRFYAFWLPFLFDSTEDMVKFVNNDKVKKEVNGWCNDLEMSMLGINNAGARQISSNKKITSPEDLKGMNIRVPGANIFIDLYRKYFKANPTAMDFSEVYTSLQQGTIDGQENPIAAFNSSKFSEVQSHILMWDGVRDTNIWVISNCASDALEWGNEYLAENESDIVEQLKKQGVEIDELTDDEKEAFKEACSGIYDEYADVVGQDVIDLFRGQK